MSRKIISNKQKRPFFTRLLIPPKGLGRTTFLKGYFKRIPVYIMLIVMAGFTVTILSTLAIGDTAYVAEIDLVSTDLKTSWKHVFLDPSHRYGVVSGEITVDISEFWAIFSGDSTKTTINVYWPQIETKSSSGPHPSNGGFPVEGAHMSWESDGSGALRAINDDAYSSSTELDIKDISGDTVTFVFNLGNAHGGFGLSWGARGLANDPYNGQMKNGEWPVFQFAIQIVEDNKIVWGT